LRLANNVPMMHETRYISMVYCPNMEKYDLETSLYNIYNNEFNLAISSIEQDLSAVFLDEFSKSIFDVDDDIPGIRVDGVTYCDKDKLVEGERSFYRADKYKFSVRAEP